MATSGIVFLLGVILCWALGWALVPSLVRWQIEKQGTQSLGRVVHVDQVVFKPWSMTLVVRGLEVGQAGAPMTSADPQVTVEEIEINAAWRSLLELAPVIDALVVRQPQLHITHLGQGRFDFDDVLQRLGSAKSESSGVPRLSLFNIQVVGGAIRFRDAPQSVTHTLTDLRLDVPFLSNMDGRREVSTHPRLAFKLNGAAFDTDAQTTPFTPDRHTQARFQIQGLDVAPYLPYWPAAWPMRLSEGRVEADITLDFRQQTTPQVQVSGRLALAGLKLNERVNAGTNAVTNVRGNAGAELPWVQLGGLEVQVANWQPLRDVLQIDALRLDQPVVHVRRDRAGALNWSRLQRLAAPAGDPADAQAQTDALYAVKQLQVTGGQVQWHDAATPTPTPTSMPVALALTEIDLQSANLSWPRPQAATWNGQAQFQGGRLSWQGVAEGQSAQASLKWRDLPIQALAPYAAQWLRPELSGQSSAELSLDWRAAEGAEPERWVLKAPLIRLAEVSLGAPHQPEARLAELTVEQLEVDVLQHQARVGRVALSRPQWRLSRSAQGRWSVDDWQVPGRPTADAAADERADTRVDARADDRADVASGSAVSSAPWRLNLRQVQVRGLTLDLDDRLAGDAARLRWGDLNYAGELNLAWPEAGMDLNARGQVSLAKLRAVSLPEGEEVLAVQTLDVRGLDAGFQSGEWAHLKVAETTASDFFARVDIDPTGRLNLSSLVKTSAPSPSPAQRPGKTPLVVLGPMSVVNGRVLFSDHFIRPHYSADVTELAGSLGALSNQTQDAQTASLAALSLRGRVAGSASLEVNGRINPLTRPVALDVRGQVRDLELPQLSPYSAKYAGYGIERGKLSADVNYRIDADGQLQASHQLTLNQLRFGEHSELEGAPNLPVKLAVALLADRHGVIDLDLPVSGSINDPDFRVGAIVWRMVLNLVGKAILSPFSLMAGALGGADELQHMPFAPGQAELDAAARPKLAAVAQLLQDKPALRLTLVGEADLKSEREAWRRLKLLDLLQAERRRASKGDAPDAPVVIDAGSEDYLALLKSAYRRSPIPKPRNVLGLVKDLPPADMEALLLAAMAVDESDMRALANARAAHVRQALLDLNVPADQLFMGAAVVAEADRKAPFVPQVTLVVSTD